MAKKGRAGKTPLSTEHKRRAGKTRNKTYVIHQVRGRMLSKKVTQLILFVIAVLVIFIMIVTLVPSPPTIR